MIINILERRSTRHCYQFGSRTFWMMMVLFPSLAVAELNVVATTTTLASIAKELGGDKVKVTSITHGPQDPHFVEAKPSYMLIVNKADLLIANGRDLESGWLPNIIKGARNPKVQPSANGYFEACIHAAPIEVPEGKVDRAQGDIHPEGNPHCLLDPDRVIDVSKALLKKFIEVDTANQAHYEKTQSQFVQKLGRLSQDIRRRLVASGVRHIVTYHKTLNYFLARYDLIHTGSIEPKPGIPPTAKHIIGLIDTIKKKPDACLLVESFFESDSAMKLSKDTGVKFKRVATEVDSLPEAKDYFSMLEHLVKSIEECKK